jgi:hypothetical protein
MEQTLYTTPQAAEKTEIPEGTIRSWLSRYPGLFVENIHIVIESSGRKLWTEKGLELLRNRKGEGETATESAAPTDSFTDAAEGEILEPMLDITSRKLAVRFFQLLPSRVANEIRAMVNNPETEGGKLAQEAMRTAIAGGVLLQLPESRRLAG